MRDYLFVMNTSDGIMAMLLNFEFLLGAPFNRCLVTSCAACSSNKFFDKSNHTVTMTMNRSFYLHDFQYFLKNRGAENFCIHTF